MCDRVVALVDMDCFYCQVEERLQPELKGKPTVVVQYNPWKGGGIIAVNYEARAQGVKRGMRGEQAKQLCPDIVLCSVPMIREKADLARYRDAGREVIDVMCKFSECVQRASIDEAYLDLTAVVENRLNEFQNGVPANKIPNTFVVGYTTESSNDEEQRLDGTRSWLNDLYSSGLNDMDAKKLAVGAVVVEEMRQEILNVTGFKCSAGIAHNKILAKYAAGIHKPNRQTVLPQSSVAQLYTTLPIHKIRNLGGKLGRELEDVHNVKVMSDLLKFSQAELTKLCEERIGNWLYHLARGYDNEPVTPRLVPKSIACCKNFPGKMSLSKGKEVDHWLNKLTEELLERLLEDETMNQRKAQNMVFSIRLQDGDRGREVSSSKSVTLISYNHEKIVNSARTCLKKFCTQDPSSLVWSPIITFLGLSAGKFVDSSNRITQLFNAMKKNRPSRVEKAIELLPGDATVENERFEDDGSEESMRRSKYFSDKVVGRTDELMPPVNTVMTVKENTVPDPPWSKDKMNHSSLDESTGPSFFERMLLENVPENGKRIKLNVIPDLPQISPQKNIKDANVEPALCEQKIKSNKISDFFEKSPSADIPGQGNTDMKMVKPSKDAITSFFGKQTTSWVDPKEIFPDVEGIDDETLALFPLSYQKRILELKNLGVKNDSDEICGRTLVSGKSLFTKESINLESKGCCVPSSFSKANDGECMDVSAGGKIVTPTKYEFHDSQQPSTSKCGLGGLSPIQMVSSPQDMFDSDSPDFARPGPSTEFNSSKWFSNEANPPLDNDGQNSARACPECQVFLPPEDYDEHLDYHFALRLQEEMNQNSAASRPPTTAVANKVLKRKPNPKKGKQPEPKKIKSIDSFFKKAS